MMLLGYRCHIANKYFQSCNISLCFISRCSTSNTHTNRKFGIQKIAARCDLKLNSTNLDRSFEPYDRCDVSRDEEFTLHYNYINEFVERNRKVSMRYGAAANS